MFASCNLLALIFSLICVSEAVCSPLFPVLANNSLAKTENRVGFIDETGNLKIGFKFYYAQNFSESLSAVLFVKNGKWAYINKKGEIIIKPQFDEAAPFTDGFARVVKDGKAYFIKVDGEKAFETSLFLLGFSDGLSPARLLGKWGFVNHQSKVAVDFKFQNANHFSEGLAYVVQNDLAGYIDKSGEWIIPPRFSPISGYSDSLFLPNFSGGLAVYRDKNKYGYIDKMGAIAIPAVFERAESFSENLALVRMDGKVGYIRKGGKYAIKPIFENGEKFSIGLAPIQIGGKWGYVGTSGILQVKPKYDTAEPFTNGLAEVSNYKKKDGSTIRGYINRKGHLIYSWRQ